MDLKRNEKKIIVSLSSDDFAKIDKACENEFENIVTWNSIVCLGKVEQTDKSDRWLFENKGKNSVISYTRCDIPDSECIVIFYPEGCRLFEIKKSYYDLSDKGLDVISRLKAVDSTEDLLEDIGVLSEKGHFTAEDNEIITSELKRIKPFADKAVSAYNQWKGNDDVCSN